MSLQLILDQLAISGARSQRVSGGDINSCWCIESSNGNYFLKVNNRADYPGMFQKEARGLEALKNNSTFFIPSVIQQGTTGKDQYMLLEWLEQSADYTNHQGDAGEKLATLHFHHQDWFGWIENNYIGSLPQENTRHDNWPSFYAACRIQPLVKRLFDKKLISQADLISSEKFCLRLSDLFPSEPASLLHGDLWSGNYMNTVKGPSIFDPAVYYGHREMDIGMTKLFGGFNADFYRGYEEIYPLEKGWQHRLDYTQLYPLLVHAVLFGGSYVKKAINIMK